LEKNGVNVVISTEHCYKNPERAFSFLKKEKPDNCWVFPGVEYLTKEGADVIIFSDRPDFYQYKELTPFNLTYEETVNFVKKNGLFSFIAHPHTLGFSSVIKKLGKESYLQFSNQLGAVEIANSSFNNLYLFLNKPFLKIFFRKKIRQIEKVKKVPGEDYPEKIKFLAAGSDAHHIKETGACVIIETEPENLFEKIVSNQEPVLIEKSTEKINYLLLAKSALTSFREFSKKKKIIIKNALK